MKHKILAKLLLAFSFFMLEDLPGSFKRIQQIFITQEFKLFHKTSTIKISQIIDNIFSNLVSKIHVKIFPSNFYFFAESEFYL